MSAPIRRRTGATAIEYGLIAMLVAVSILLALILLGQVLDRTFSHVSDTVSESTGFGPSSGS